MDNPESLLENETHKIFWDFEKQTNHLILARRPDLCDSQQQQKKRESCKIVDLIVPADYWVKP